MENLALFYEISVQPDPSPDLDEAILVRHLAPAFVRLSSGLIALYPFAEPAQILAYFSPDLIPTAEDLLTAHRARQAAFRPTYSPPTKPLLKTLDLSTLIRKSQS